MIIVAIIALSGVVLAALLVVFGNGLPAIPVQVIRPFERAIEYIDSAKQFVGCFVHVYNINVMIDLTLTAIAIYEGYKLVMWIAKKIPMFGVSD